MEERENFSPTHSFATLDLRDPEQFPDATEHNDAIFNGNTVWGVEVTNPEFAERCAVNIDPQHIGRDHTTAAIEEAITVPLPTENVVFITVRPDLDSIGGMAVLMMRTGNELLDGEVMERIKLIADVDKFSNGPYPGPKPAPTEDNMWDNENREKVAAINAEITDITVPLEKRVAAMTAWLRTGAESEEYRVRAVKERMDMIHDFSNGNITHETRSGGKITVVETTHADATSIGYWFAPVVVIRNPAHPVDGGETQIKYTICTWNDTFADIRGALDELNEIEPGWGGQQNIGGSPEIGDSELTVDRVAGVVEKYLK